MLEGEQAVLWGFDGELRGSCGRVARVILKCECLIYLFLSIIETRLL